MNKYEITYEVPLIGGSTKKIQENIEFNKKSNDKIIYYYVVDESDYLIHSKYADEIYNNLNGLIRNL